MSATEIDTHWKKEEEYVMSRRGGHGQKEGEKIYYFPSSSGTPSSPSCIGKNRKEHIKTLSPVRNYSVDSQGRNTGRLLVRTNSYSDSQTGSGSYHLSPTSSQMTSPSSAVDKEQSEKFLPPSEKPPPPPSNEENHERTDQTGEESITEQMENFSVNEKEQTKSNSTSHFTPNERDHPEPSALEADVITEENEPKPFSHVKKDIVFSSEPLPGERLPISAYYPPLSQQLSRKDEKDNSAYKTPIPRAVSPPLLMEDSNPPVFRSGPVGLRQLSSSEQDTELQYLSLAADNHENSTGDANFPNSSVLSRVRMDTENHWLVQEAKEEGKISEQVKEEQATPLQLLVNSSHSATSHYENLPLQQPDTYNRPTPPKHPPPLPPTSEPSEQDQVVSVSGRQKCSHCSEELGRGAAMIIESLNLFYHLGCFRCYVCGVALGNGSEGADVRIRAGKLHCQSCYSNDEVGLKFSEV